MVGGGRWEKMESMALAPERRMLDKVELISPGELVAGVGLSMVSSEGEIGSDKRRHLYSRISGEGEEF